MNTDWVLIILTWSNLLLMAVAVITVSFIVIFKRSLTAQKAERIIKKFGLTYVSTDRVDSYKGTGKVDSYLVYHYVSGELDVEIIPTKNIGNNYREFNIFIHGWLRPNGIHIRRKAVRIECEYTTKFRFVDELMKPNNHIFHSVFEIIKISVKETLVIS